MTRSSTRLSVGLIGAWMTLASLSACGDVVLGEHHPSPPSAAGAAMEAVLDTTQTAGAGPVDQQGRGGGTFGRGGGGFDDFMPDLVDGENTGGAGAGERMGEGGALGRGESVVQVGPPADVVIHADEDEEVAQPEVGEEDDDANEGEFGDAGVQEAPDAVMGAPDDANGNDSP